MRLKFFRRLGGVYDCYFELGTVAYKYIRTDQTADEVRVRRQRDTSEQIDLEVSSICCSALIASAI